MKVHKKGYLKREKIEDILLKLLSSPNIVSKENWARRYDHEVLGSSHIKPFVGKRVMDLVTVLLYGFIPTVGKKTQLFK